MYYVITEFPPDNFSRVLHPCLSFGAQNCTLLLLAPHSVKQSVLTPFCAKECLYSKNRLKLCGLEKNALAIKECSGY